MIYTDLTKKAINIMYKAHEGQRDKSGLPYVFHPWHVAESMKDEESTCTALLHDVVEDTEITLEDLKKEGMPQSVIDALSVLTHGKEMPHMDYIRELSSNRIARRVKLSDLAHNMDLSRLNEVTERDLERLKKYREAKEYLEKILND